MSKRRIAVIGDGAWGSALAHVARQGGHDVGIWSRKRPDAEALAGTQGVIIAVPAQAVRQVLLQVKVPRDAAIIIAAKGIERGSGLFMHQVVQSLLPDNAALILSGPSFADDVLKGLPTAVTLGGPNLDSASTWATALSVPTFRIYASDDVLGVAIGGAMKNVLAMACGISDGRGLGDSARAALVTRSFAELTRFGRALGARAETLMGLSCLGDLMLTCTSTQSRNYMTGHRLGAGMTVAQAVAASKGTVEGYYTAQVATELAARLNVEMPIVSAVHAILDRGSNPEVEINRLLSRPVRAEL
ncbi:MAG: NAD(P)H-dependent glycerol-3-phosphate dehydrogenase [Hyphomicrobiales bacterium]